MSIRHAALRRDRGAWWLEILLEPVGDYLPRRVRLCLHPDPEIRWRLEL